MTFICPHCKHPVLIVHVYRKLPDKIKCTNKACGKDFSPRGDEKEKNH